MSAFKTLLWQRLTLTLGLQSADDLARRFLIADANILTSYRLTLDAADVLVRSDIGEFDVPRARDGGLNPRLRGAALSDDAFYQVLAQSEAPVIASHSSCRAFTPGWERNMSDAMIRTLAEGGGVIHITFGGSFLSTELQQRERPVWAHVEDPGFSINSVEGRRMAQRFRQEKGIRYATIGHVVDHIDHVRDLVGIDHVGIGSGFDGSGDSMPDGLKDVSDYASLIEELLKRGYMDDVVEKILSGNLLRVWAQVERIAKL